MSNRELIEEVARAISGSYGEDPDEDAPLSKVCTNSNQPLPNWVAYEEQAVAALAALSALEGDGDEHKYTPEATDEILRLANGPSEGGPMTAEELTAFLGLAGEGAKPVAWYTVETAPKDGTHFLAADFTRGAVGFGYFKGHTMAQPMMTVVHWYDGFPDHADAGFYTSVNELEPQRPFYFTDWMPLPDKRQSNGVVKLAPLTPDERGEVVRAVSAQAEALAKCIEVFEKLADVGNYPEPLLNNGGWLFADTALRAARALMDKLEGKG